MGVLYYLLPAASVLCLLGCGAPAENGSDKPDVDAGIAQEGGNDGAQTDTDGEVRWLTDSIVDTLAGSANSGLSDGKGEDVLFNNPVNVERSPSGEFIVADFNNHALRRLDSDGTVSTEVVAEGFIRPFGLAFTKDGRLFAQTDATDPGDMTTESGALWEIVGTEAKMLRSDIGRPRGMVAVEGGLVLADPAHDVVLWYDLATDKLTVLAGARDKAGFVDGDKTEARFDGPYGIVMHDGCVAVADQRNHAIRCVTLKGKVSTIAGTGEVGLVDGPASEARFRSPQDLAADEHGNLYVADRGNVRVRRIDADGEVTTVAGAGEPGFRDGPGRKAQFFGMEGIDVRPDGKVLYVADGNGGDPGPYNRVRMIEIP